MAPWDGSGGFTRDNGSFTGAETWKRTANAKHNVRSDQQDTHDQDLAEGLENCLTRDGQNSPSDHLPMNAKRHTNVAEATARNHYANLGQLQDGAPGYVPAAQVGGTANVITLTPSPAIPAYVTGMRFTFAVKTTNTAAATINVSGLGAKTVRMRGRTSKSGDLVAGDVVTVLYDGTQFRPVDFTPGNAAYRNVGTTSGTLALLGAGGRFAQARMARAGKIYKTAAYTVTTADHGKTIHCNTTNGAFTVTLPDLGAADLGFEVTITKTSGNAANVLIDGHGTDRINGRSSIRLGHLFDSVTLYWYGNDWQIIASHRDYDLLSLVDAATIAWNVEAYPVARVVLGGNRTLGAAQSAREGGVYVLVVQQQATGGRTLSFATSGTGAYTFGEYGTPVIAAGAHRKTFLTFLYYGARMRMIGISRNH